MGLIAPKVNFMTYIFLFRPLPVRHNFDTGLRSIDTFFKIMLRLEIFLLVMSDVIYQNATT